MSSRHKQIEHFNDTIKVGTGYNGIFLIRKQIDHVGKDNHVIQGGFTVQQTANNADLDIRFYIITECQFVDWILPNITRTNTTFSYPKNTLHGSNLEKIGNFRIQINESYSAYFLLDNRHSFSTPKEIKVLISEEWDEATSNLDLVTTIPPHDKSIKHDVERLISSSKHDLKIITPYIDMSLISEILQKHSNGVNIEIITRTRKDFAGKGAKEGFDYINKTLGKKHKTNEHIHSRIILKDSQEALVSSADLTQDSLLGQFNAGVVVSEHMIIKKLLNYFKNVWDKSSFD